MNEENEGEPFELRLRKDTVWYRVRELEGILKQINEIANNTDWNDLYELCWGMKQIKEYSDV